MGRNREIETYGLVGESRGGKRSRAGVPKGQNKKPDPAEKRAFRARVLKEREIDMIGEALILRGRSPEESIEIMFDMAEFVEDMAKAVEDA